jgi:hypothetical protein
MLTRSLIALVLIALPACAGDDSPAADAAPTADGTARADAAAFATSVVCADLPTSYPRTADLPMDDYFFDLCYSGGIVDDCRVTNDGDDALGLACDASIRALSVRVHPDGASITVANGWRIDDSSVGSLDAAGSTASAIPVPGQVSVQISRPMGASYTLALDFTDADHVTVTAFTSP